jgi:nitrous oxidase accessory protein NosD
MPLRQILTAISGLLLTATGIAQQRHLVSVNKSICPTATYTSLQSAIDAAAPGDRIDVCPGIYPEQLLISKAITVQGLHIAGQGRVQIQPTTLAVTEYGVAALTVLNSYGIHLRNIAVDASKNTISACAPTLSAVHFFNASGELEDSAVSGAMLTNSAACATLSGNGFGVLIESTDSRQHRVEVERTSIHDYTKDGIRVIGNGAWGNVNGNIISGLGPAGGYSFQFGIFALNGARVRIVGNQITEGDCGLLALPDCVNARSEGVVLRDVAEGALVDNNVITRAQSGIFINDAQEAHISDNLIGNITGLDGIDAQGMSDSVLEGNTIFNVTPLSATGCGVAEAPGPGSAGGNEENNQIVRTTVNDAWCGVAYVPSSSVVASSYHNVLYTQFRSDLGPAAMSH